MLLYNLPQDCTFNLQRFAESYKKNSGKPLQAIMDTEFIDIEKLALIIKDDTLLCCSFEDEKRLTNKKNLTDVSHYALPHCYSQPDTLTIQAKFIIRLIAIRDLFKENTYETNHVSTSIESTCAITDNSDLRELLSRIHRP